MAKADSITKQSGIYQILHVPSGKLYLGSAADIHQRWRVHRGLLRKGSHHSRILQRGWDKYGAQQFVFSIL
jgi:group I intron endonuclease